MTYLQTYHTTIEDVQKIWSMDRLKDMLDEIRHDREELDSLQVCVDQQMARVDTTSFSWHVELMRRGGYSGQKIEYYVSSYQTPDIVGGKLIHVYPEESESKRFMGRERKPAREYAESLSKKYGVPIEGNMEVKS